MFSKLEGAAQKIKRELAVYRLVLGHPQTPRFAKFLLGAAVAYAVSPIDLFTGTDDLYGS